MPCTPPLKVTTINDQLIGQGLLCHQTNPIKLQLGLFHREQIVFYIITSPSNPIVLSLPGLRLHDPLISWRDGDILKWSPQCREHCFLLHLPCPCLTTSVENPSTTVYPTLPREYHDLGKTQGTSHGTTPSSSCLTPCHQEAKSIPS